MARATGSINYLEHRTPLKDESGKYQIHPMFVKQDIVDREKIHIPEHTRSISDGEFSRRIG